MAYHTIAIDFDDVLVPTASLIQEHYNETYGTELELKDIMYGDKQKWGVSKIELAVERIEAFLANLPDHDLRGLSSVADATRILASTYELHVVTSRSQSLASATNTLVIRHFHGIFQSVVFAGVSGNVDRSKSEICRELQADLLIDDNPRHVIETALSGTEAWLFGNYPWNQIPLLPPKCRKVRNWDEVLILLQPSLSTS